MDNSNWFCRMQNYIILRLCGLLWHAKDKIRLIIGMCEEHYKIKNHPFFIHNRPKTIFFSLLPEPIGSRTAFIVQPVLSMWYRVQCAIGSVLPKMAPSTACSLHPHPMECSFTSAYNDKTLFIDHAVTKGVFRWTVRIAFAKRKNASGFHMGVASPGLLTACYGQILGGVEGAFSFCFARYCNDELRSWTPGMGYNHWIDHPNNKIPVMDGSLVSIETDCAAHTLAFFVGDAMAPHVFSEVYAPFHFGISGWRRGDKSSFASVAFRRLPSATPSAGVGRV